MPKQFAIFDIDGTLLDSMELWRNLGREYLESKGITENLDDVLEEIRPMTMGESAALFAKRFALGKSPEAVADEMNSIMHTHYCNDIPLKPGAKKHLEKLRLAGVRLCVASVIEEHLMEASLMRLGVRSYFEFIISCESIGASKREPDIYLEAARRFGASPGDIAVYEDALYAIETAKKAGFYVVAVYDKAAKIHWDQIRRLADEIICFDNISSDDDNRSETAAN